MNLDKYKIPAQVAAALTSGRTELLAMGKIDFTDVEETELVRLLADLIDDRRRMASKLELMGQVVAEATRTMNGHARRLEVAIDAVREVPTREDMETALENERSSR